MKILKIIIATFLIAFATSTLLDFDVFSKNIVRYILVVILIITELLIGFFYAKSETKSLKNNQN
jgi:hypothetical protein